MPPERPVCPSCGSRLHRDRYTFVGRRTFYQCAPTGCCGWFIWSKGTLVSVTPCEQGEEEGDA